MIYTVPAKYLNKEIEWRKIIGKRNALVHDYLNIEPEIIRQVIKQNVYLGLYRFAEEGIYALKK
jgi:uncharacterized protein with HEPN domain